MQSGILMTLQANFSLAAQALKKPWVAALLLGMVVGGGVLLRWSSSSNRPLAHSEDDALFAELENLTAGRQNETLSAELKPVAHSESLQRVPGAPLSPRVIVDEAVPSRVTPAMAEEVVPNESPSLLPPPGMSGASPAPRRSMLTPPSGMAVIDDGPVLPVKTLSPDLSQPPLFVRETIPIAADSATSGESAIVWLTGEIEFDDDRGGAPPALPLPVCPADSPFSVTAPGLPPRPGKALPLIVPGNAPAVQGASVQLTP